MRSRERDRASAYHAAGGDDAIRDDGARGSPRARTDELRRLGAEGVGLTVRADSEGARDLYVSLGFREERFVVPMRLGFSVA